MNTATDTNPAANAALLNLTEADVKAYFAAVTAHYAPQFPGVREFHATHSQFPMPTGAVGFYGYIGSEGWTSISGYGATFAEAARELRQKIGTPEIRAEALRKQAAQLLSEAAQLVPAEVAQ